MIYRVHIKFGHGAGSECGQQQSNEDNRNTKRDTMRNNLKRLKLLVAVLSEMDLEAFDENTDYVDRGCEVGSGSRSQSVGVGHFIWSRSSN